MNLLLVMAIVGAAGFAVALLASAPMPALVRRARKLGTATDEAWSLAAQRSGLFDSLQQQLDQAGLLRGSEARVATALLAEAGWRSPAALMGFITSRLVLPLLAGVFTWGVVHAHNPSVAPALLAGAAAIMLAGQAPKAVVRNAATRRRQAIAKALPDALDLFVICAEAGLSFDAGIRRIARELAPSAPALADELALTGIELGFLPRRADALHNLAARVPLPNIRGIVAILAQTERYGTPLAQSLRVLAAEFRNTRMLKAEEKAARLPALLTIPMIVFILPPLFIVLIGSAIIGMLGV